MDDKTKAAYAAWMEAQEEFAATARGDREFFLRKRIKELEGQLAVSLAIVRGAKAAHSQELKHRRRVAELESSLRDVLQTTGDGPRRDAAMRQAQKVLNARD